MIDYIILNKDYEFKFDNFKRESVYIYGFGVNQNNYEEFIKGKMKFMIDDKLIEQVDLLFLTKINKIIKKSETLIYHHSFHPLFKRAPYLGLYNTTYNVRLLLEFEEEIDFPIKVYYFYQKIIDETVYNYNHQIEYPIIKYYKNLTNHIKHQLNNQVIGFLIEPLDKIKDITILINKNKYFFNDIMIELVFNKINQFLFIDTNNPHCNFLSKITKNTNIEIIINHQSSDDLLNNNIFNVYPIFKQILIYQFYYLIPYYLY